MGQRLNMEIKKKGKVLANAYYHWSAYTSSSYEITLDCIKYIQQNRDLIKDSRLLAIRALESTGAGMNEEDLEYMKNFKSYFNLNFEPCRGRNEGILGVLPSSIEETQAWAEGTVILNIDDLNDIRISFDVLGYWEDKKYYEEECLENDKDEIKKFEDNLEHIEFDDSDMSIDELETLMDLILNKEKYVEKSDGYILCELV